MSGFSSTQADILPFCLTAFYVKDLEKKKNLLKKINQFYFMASSFTAQVVLKKTYRLHLTALPALEGQIQSIGPKIALV